MNHSFDIELAKKYGIEEAIIIENLAFWIKKNFANNKNIIDGYCWVYNSAKAFQEYFNYISESKIWRTLKKLEDKKILKSGNFNKVGFDRTKWYTITEKSILQKYKIDFTKYKIHSSNCEMDFNKMQNQILQNEGPIPDTIPDINTDTIPDINIHDLPDEPEPEADIPPNTQDSKSKKQVDLENQIQAVYALYPTIDKNNNNRSLGKGLKNRHQIRKLLTKRVIEFETLKQVTVLYLDIQANTKGYLKNFETFLNNLPDLSEQKETLKQLELEKRDPTIKQDDLIYGNQDFNYVTTQAMIDQDLRLMTAEQRKNSVLADTPTIDLATGKPIECEWLPIEQLFN